MFLETDFTCLRVFKSITFAYQEKFVRHTCAVFSIQIKTSCLSCLASITVQDGQKITKYFLGEHKVITSE